MLPYDYGLDNYRLHVHFIPGRFWGRDNPSSRIIESVVRGFPRSCSFSCIHRNHFALKVYNGGCFNSESHGCFITYSSRARSPTQILQNCDEWLRANSFFFFFCLHFYCTNDWFVYRRRQLNDTHFLSHAAVKCHSKKLGVDCVRRRMKKVENWAQYIKQVYKKIFIRYLCTDKYE